MTASLYVLKFTGFTVEGQELGTGVKFFNHEPGDDELDGVLYRHHVECPAIHTFVSRLSPMNVGIDLAKPDSP